MDLFLQNEFSVISVGFGIFVAINTLFFKMDDFFSKEFREDISIRLLCLNIKKYDTGWSYFFVKLFDIIFKKNNTKKFNLKDYITLYTFSRSCIASIVSAVIVIAIGLTIGPLRNPDVLLSLSKYWSMIVVVFLIANTFPDYVSLLETRYILKFLVRDISIVSKFILILVDIFITFLIFSLTIFSLMISTEIAEKGDDFNILESAIYFVNILIVGDYKVMLWLEAGGLGSITGIFLYSTLFTSIWLWLFTVSSIMISLLSKVDGVVELFKYVFPIEEKPFRSIGIVSGLIGMMSYYVVAIVSRM